MPPNYKKLQEKITFDDLMETLSEEFEQLPDHRRANSSYELADVLRSAFAISCDCRIGTMPSSLP